MEAKLARSGGQICIKSPRTECESFAFFSPPLMKEMSHLLWWQLKWVEAFPQILQEKLNYLQHSPSSINSVPKWWNMVRGVSQLPEWLISTLTICIFLTKDFTKPSPGKGGWEEAETRSWLCHSSGWRMRHKLPLQNHSFLNAKLVQ